MRKMTEKALQEAFAGESMAHMKYLAFSEAATGEGFPNVARLFRAIGFAEQVHATNHARSLGLIGETEGNLEEARAGEDFEVGEMYPTYEAIAQLQGEKGAERVIHYALEAEKIHRGLYEGAKEGLQKGNDLGSEAIYICPICGYTHIGKPPERCPVCNLPGEKFRRF